jgi:DNA-binding transcriptional ArsR family regulator
VKELRELKLILHACADITRLRILRLLADGGERSVTDLTITLRLSQPLVSWHLRILRRSGLIATRRVGRQSFYRLNRAGWDGFQRRLDQVTEPGAESALSQTWGRAGDGAWDGAASARLGALRHGESVG